MRTSWRLCVSGNALSRWCNVNASKYSGSGREFGMFMLAVGWSVMLSVLAVKWLLVHGYMR